jgi:hypothetical protein
MISGFSLDSDVSGVQHTCPAWTNRRLLRRTTLSGR